MSGKLAHKRKMKREDLDPVRRRKLREADQWLASMLFGIGDQLRPAVEEARARIAARKAAAAEVGAEQK